MSNVDDTTALAAPSKSSSPITDEVPTTMAGVGLSHISRRKEMRHASW